MDEKILALGEHFALAAVDGNEWVPALRAMAEMTGSAHGQLIGFVPGAVPFNWINDTDEVQIARFVEQERGDPDINVRVRASLNDRPFVIRSEADYRAVGTGPGFDLYREMCDAYDISFGCQTKLVEGRDHFIGLSLNRSRKDGETDADTRALFAAIAPYVRSAVRIQMALEDRGAAILNGALEYTGLPVFICDETGHLKANTTEAETLLSAGSFRVTDGKIGLAHPYDNAILQQALVRRHRHSLGFETLMFGGDDQQMPIIADLCRLPRQPWHLGLASQFLIIVRSGRRWHDAAPAILRTAFGLSAAETDVALALASGETRDEIAATRNTSVQTVKAQLKSIFGKVGVNREVELVAMFAGTLRR
ncbi:helix-turn-helix transcriptional regulator [Novosphingobium sp.]|uniref:helix-turn-helix transcriptional regulator n=1 Tax=Novosphingobium sp. TaxID=1874826 RepID=UPI002FDB509A